MSLAPAQPSKPGVRVASVPGEHVYVRHLTDLNDTSVTRLPDPPPVGGPRAPGEWWPPTMLTPEWIESSHEEFDIFHVHFGFDALTGAQLNQVVSALRRAGKPLVYTVHDLRNPHHHSRVAHDEALDVLIPAADTLVTLTRGAAEAIEKRWGRVAEVIPHPHVADLAAIGAPRPGHADPSLFVVGVHARSLRAGVRPVAVVRELLPLVGELPGLRVRFDVHHEVHDHRGRRHDARLRAFCDEAVRDGRLDLRVHDFYEDQQFWAYLRSLDVSVLPYRFGTHSGWLEACYDLGTTVLAPSCGYYGDQRPCFGYRHDEEGLDGESLREAVRSAYEQRPVWHAGTTERVLERQFVALAHRRMYDAVLA